MKRKSRRPAPSRGLAIALVFVCVVASLVAISLALKGYLVVRASRFDGTHQFILRANGPDKTSFIAFNPDTKSVTELSVLGSMPHPVLLADASVEYSSTGSPMSLADTLIS